VFEGFELETVRVGTAAIRVRRGGTGPPVLLLHGCPQTHVMWHLVAPALARRHTVVAPDLPGYGDSSKPPTVPGHATYAKRAMAGVLVEMMDALGLASFTVVGHDRGARCAYRMALDHPGRVRRLVVLDVIPTAEVYRRTDMASAMSAWHWFVLPQPFDLPERLVAADPEAFFFRRGTGAFAPEAAAEYLRCLRDPATVHAICEDYRAGATIDVEHDEAQRGRARIACPVLALWSERGLGRRVDVLDVWRSWARDVCGRGLACGHFIAEEAPGELLCELDAFLAPELDVAPARP